MPLCQRRRCSDFNKTLEICDILQVLHMELGIAGSGMRYQPGDSIGISVRNDPALVETLLQRLGVDGTRVFSVEHAGPEAGSAAHLLPHLQWPCTARHALSVRYL